MHDLHVWGLSEKKFVGTVHVLISEGSDYCQLSRQIQVIFHDHGVHMTTCQPEFVRPATVQSSNEVCSLSRLIPRRHDGTTDAMSAPSAKGDEIRRPAVPPHLPSCRMQGVHDLDLVGPGCHRLYNSIIFGRWALDTPPTPFCCPFCPHQDW